MTPLVYPALSIAAVTAVYWNSAAGVFAFDDHPSITANPYIRQLWLSLSTPPGIAISGRPAAAL